MIKGQDLYQKAKTIIPGGVMLLVKEDFAKVRQIKNGI